MLELSGISKRYGDAQALALTDLSVAEAHTTVLIGPSGCGKSTLLRLIAGLILPDSGTITVEGVPLAPENLMDLRHRMGYVIQEGGLFPHLTAGGNVTLMAKYLGQPSEKVAARLSELAELMQISPQMLARYPKALSGGQRQRVALMRGLMLDPPILLMDEPLGALDPMIRFELQNDLKGIFSRLQKTVVLITHDMNEAAYFADEIILMREGRVIQTGALDELLTAPAQPFVTDFIRAQRADARLAAP